MLFTARSQAVSTHKGQVSFPGGHIEAGEDAAAAAVREAVEECGSGIGPVQVLGLCQTVPAGIKSTSHSVILFQLIVLSEAAISTRVVCIY